MKDIFSASEIVKMGVEIEKNGRDFYNSVKAVLEDATAKEIFLYLANEEEKHIKTFSDILSGIESYQPAESYTAEYFAYLKALADSHIFTKADTGRQIAAKVKSGVDAVNLAIGFEKDSILFYSEMKNFVMKKNHKAVDNLIEQERFHLIKLLGLRAGLK